MLEERQRIAREIHDSVAHALTALVVQAQVGRRLIGRDPEQAAAAVARCKDMARAALQETRQAVRALHPAGLEQLSEVDALQRLGRDFGIATGMAGTVTADDGAGALPPDPIRLEQLYRICQEALTNAHRHGQAGSVDVALTVAGDMLHLTIRNDGHPPAALEPGVGLQSMAERARSLGGRIAYEPGPAGMTVRVAVPLSRGVTSWGCEIGPRPPSGPCARASREPPGMTFGMGAPCPAAWALPTKRCGPAHVPGRLLF